MTRIELDEQLTNQSITAIDYTMQMRDWDDVLEALKAGAKRETEKLNKEAKMAGQILQSAIGNTPNFLETLKGIIQTIDPERLEDSNVPFLMSDVHDAHMNVVRLEQLKQIQTMGDEYTAVVQELKEAKEDLKTSVGSCVNALKAERIIIL